MSSKVRDYQCYKMQAKIKKEEDKRNKLIQKNEIPTKSASNLIDYHKQRNNNFSTSKQRNSSMFQPCPDYL